MSPGAASVMMARSYRRTRGGVITVASARPDIAILPRPVVPVDPDVERVVAALLRDDGGVVGVCSGRDADDPSVAAIAIASELARHTEGSVVLVEASLRARSRMHELLDMPPRPGVIDVIRRPALAGCAIRPTRMAGVSVLPSGAERPSVGSVVDAGLARVIAEGLLRAPWVVVIGPPLDERGDGDIVAQRCNRIVLVAPPRRGRKKVLRSVSARVGADVLAGTVHAGDVRAR